MPWKSAVEGKKIELKRCENRIVEGNVNKNMAPDVHDVELEDIHRCPEESD